MNNPSSATHKHMQHSTTLNRKYVKRPTAQATTTTEATPKQKFPVIQSIAKRQSADLARRQALAEKMNRERLANMRQAQEAKKQAATAMMLNTKQAQPTTTETPDQPATTHPMQATANARMAAAKAQQSATTTQPTAQELKDQAIKRALRSVATAETKEKKSPTKRIKAHTFTAKKIALAVACAAVAVAAIGYFVNLNMPDISVRVTAMQSGIDDPYPSYIPRGYSFSSSVSEGEKIVMEFSNSDGESFSLSEEKSSWDSKALLNNYVETKWDDYQPVREQGLTIYISGSDAVWVNGGIKYEIDASGNNLTKKQIKAIATSL